MQVKFTIYGQPNGKGRHRVQVRGNKVHTYTPEKTASYENLVKLMYSYQVGQKRLQGAIRATIFAYYSIPSSWSKKRKEAACKCQIRPQTKPDTDNIAKIILDSLNGVAYDDDKQVVELHAYKFYDETPRVEVILEEIGG